MISRYKRKPVSQTSQINLSLSSIQTLSEAAENRPHPDKGEGFPGSLVGHKYDEASECESISDVSENSGFPRNDTEVSWSVFQSCTGLSTDNSSVLSWGFDEFDKAATRQVQKIFKQIDELLYEQKASTLVEGLQEECQQWTSSFPHLRVQGKQVVPPAVDGYSWYSSHSETAASIPFSATHTKESSWVFLVQSFLSPPIVTPLPRGLFLSMLKRMRMKIMKGLSCQTVQWRNIWLLTAEINDDRQDIAIKTTRLETLNPYAPLQRHPLVLPPVSHSKIPPISPNLANRSQVGSIMNQRNLSDLMLIHGIPLQQRNLHLMEKVLDSDDKSPMRPTSAALISGKPRPGRSLEHSSSSLSHNVPSARRRNPPRTLHPINNNPSRSGTPKMEEVIRGTRLQTANDQMPCSPVPFNRNNLLPPIGTTDTEYQNLPGSQRQTPDDQMGRSFVISEQSHPLRYRRSSEGIDSISIGVTGIGLSIASSSASSLQWGQSINEKKEDRDDQHSGTPLLFMMKSHSRGGPLTRSRHGL
ncbi:primary cilium assembly protein FAM149B1 isoform X4 [Hyla sarda]|uniref:primary cilium assembly protein FAM149B1 isoform X4 n=1 Tax=Hyla sarda TaxID=327740 RepID=UPI0024C35896|nr:primary cilium assembly protein FAM149B1 isoform X4 [Hyla sarda]